MKVLIQRVTEARVTVEGKVVGEIGPGLLLLYGVHKDDDGGKIDWLADKVVGLRIFEDEEGKMNRSVKDVGGKLLVVSQFTLYGECDKGKRPSFTCAMSGSTARDFYEDFVSSLRDRIDAHSVEKGEFGSHMQVHLVNDGPVTFLLTR